MNLANQNTLNELGGHLCTGDDPRGCFSLFGYDVGDGWFLILKKLIEDLLVLDTKKELHFGQVKEKFGRLRVYMNGYNKEVERLIAIAEGESGRTCEECGAPAKTESNNYWLSTLCKECQR